MNLTQIQNLETKLYVFTRKSVRQLKIERDLLVILKLLLHQYKKGRVRGIMSALLMRTVRMENIVSSLVLSTSVMSAKPNHTHCSRDDECCGNQLCVWGECLKAVSRGANGTICENQRDCNSGMCCAFTKDLLFPVCTPLPGEGESCHDPSNRLLNLITWELEPDGALDRCPCAHGLTCKIQSYSSDSLCELSFNKNQKKGMEEPLLDEISLLDFITQDIPEDYEETLINQMQEGLEKEVSVPKELDIASDMGRSFI
uniref:Dickkopf-related protein 3 n=1 Tax=Gekko japonicus TaxID=146911 RepID=Q5EHU6_GEKJA|nr:GekBS205P [Gekko japonicus]